MCEYCKTRTNCLTCGRHWHIHTFKYCQECGAKNCEENSICNFCGYDWDKKKILIKIMEQEYYFKDAVIQKENEWYCKKCGISLDELISTLAMVHNTIFCINDHKIGLSQYTEEELKGVYIIEVL